MWMPSDLEPRCWHWSEDTIPILSLIEGRFVHKRLRREAIEEDELVSPSEPPPLPPESPKPAGKRSRWGDMALFLVAKRAFIPPMSQINVRVYSTVAGLHLMEPFASVQNF